MKNFKLHMIGNAHIDPVWLWQWQEGFHEVKASFRSALDRMHEYPEFVFVSSSAAYYEWVELSDPAMFQEIKARVAEGRWQIVGGWWIQPDCNIPSGESFVRQALYGQRYFKEKFGVTAKVGYNVDSFGHHGALPQLLKKSGLDYYVFMRPESHEKTLPGRLFWWEAEDGSRVLTFRIPFGYCTTAHELDQHVRRVADELKNAAHDVQEMMCFYGVGNHGGGPTQENIESIRRLNDDPALPTLVFSTPELFFGAVTQKESSLPVVHDDLQHHASGCYAAHSGVKRWNRQAENLLITAEKLSAIAERVTAQPYPNGFDHAWKGVLFNQFHDILAGTSLEAAYDDARNAYGEAMAIAGRALNYATQSLAWHIRIEPEQGMTPLVVFNPHAWESDVPVEVEVSDLPIAYCLLDDEGREIPVQQVQSQVTTRWRSRLSFIANLPSLGYRTYRLVPRTAALNSASRAIQASDTVLENERVRLEFSTTGTIKSLRDKRNGLEVFAGEAAQAVIIDDPSDTWSHAVLSFDKVIGKFSATSLKLVEHGPVKSVIRVTSQYHNSALIQDFALYHALDRIDVAVTVDWHEQFKMLKLRFPVNVGEAKRKATCEIPYGSIQRLANGEEEPCQNWVDVSGSSADSGALFGLSILNDGKYSFDVTRNDIGLTVLRSPIYANHDPAVPEPDKQYSFIDQGVQHFNYSILPHQGSWEQAGTVRRAAELNQRPVSLLATYHDGPLPQKASFVSVDQDNVIVSVIKKAEDNDDLIVRCYETSKIQSRATIRVQDRSFEATFAPCEIKTFRVPKEVTAPISEVNLLEWSL